MNTSDRRMVFALLYLIASQVSRDQLYLSLGLGIFSLIYVIGSITATWNKWP